MTESAPDTATVNARWAHTILDQLQRAGVDHVAISPGNRCLPLIHAALAASSTGVSPVPTTTSSARADTHPAGDIGDALAREASWMAEGGHGRDARARGLTISSHIDERAAAFFALGMARVGRGVALICTSGTAGAHYYPAVIEAAMSHLPLIVVTADRPPRLRNCGAPQTIDQVNLFGNHARAFVDLPVPNDDTATLRETITHVIATALDAPRGPAHINVPFDEPLEPPSGRAFQAVSPPTRPALTHGVEGTAGSGSELRPVSTVASGGHGLEAHATWPLLERARRGLIIVGELPHDPSGETARAIARLAHATGFPIIADPLAPMRYGVPINAPVFGAHDAWLRAPEVATALQPDVVVRVGPAPVSKFLARAVAGVRTITIDDDVHPRDPSHSPGVFLRGHVQATASALAELLEERRDGIAPLGDGTLLEMLNEVEGTAWVLASRLFDGGGWGEGAVARQCFKTLADAGGGVLFVGSSTPIRDVDWFVPPGRYGVSVVGCRGANGIDGSISQALGVAHAERDRHVMALIGDVAALHDVGGLAAGARVPGLCATIVILNNDGGGIFGYLPTADAMARAGMQAGYDGLIATRHGLSFEHAAAMFGVAYQRVEDASACRAALEAAVAKRAGVRIIECRIDEAANRELTRAYFDAVARAIAGPSEAP